MFEYHTLISDPSLLSIVQGLDICYTSKWSIGTHIIETINILEQVPHCHPRYKALKKSIAVIYGGKDEWSKKGIGTVNYNNVSPRVQQKRWLKYLKSQGFLIDVAVNISGFPCRKVPISMCWMLKQHKDELISCFGEDYYNCTAHKYMNKCTTYAPICLPRC